jgi:hypothetical protein
MIDRIQRLAAALGATGCYFLCLVYLGERESGAPVDALHAFRAALLARYVREDCYVDYPERILEMIAGGGWSVEKRPADVPTAPGELEILRYDNAGASHFVVGDGSGGIAFDPYGDSRTVREGKLASKRIFTRTI